MEGSQTENAPGVHVRIIGAQRQTREVWPLATSFVPPCPSIFSVSSKFDYVKFYVIIICLCRRRYEICTVCTLPTLRACTATVASWERPYVGQDHRILVDSVRKAKRDANGAPYRNILPIIQSSGMGKSRLAHEAGNVVVTLPLNIRFRAYDIGRQPFRPR